MKNLNITILSNLYDVDYIVYCNDLLTGQNNIPFKHMYNSLKFQGYKICKLETLVGWKKEKAEELIKHEIDKFELKPFQYSFRKVSDYENFYKLYPKIKRETLEQIEKKIEKDTANYLKNVNLLLKNFIKKFS